MKFCYKFGLKWFVWLGAYNGIHLIINLLLVSSFRCCRVHGRLGSDIFMQGLLFLTIKVYMSCDPTLTLVH